MASKRDTYNYALKRGRKIVYRGITNNPERREQEHKGEGKNFTHMRCEPYPRTRQGAREKEAELLDRDRSTHGGDAPEYNEKEDG